MHDECHVSKSVDVSRFDYAARNEKHISGEDILVMSMIVYRQSKK